MLGIFRYVSDDLKDNDAIDHFGQQLEAAGYNYYGTETLYSGTDGIPMTADIFFGVIHYQRLRHMVSDKFQVSITRIKIQILLKGSVFSLNYYLKNV